MAVICILAMLISSAFSYPEAPFAKEGLASEEASVSEDAQASGEASILDEEQMPEEALSSGDAQEPEEVSTSEDAPEPEETAASEEPQDPEEPAVSEEILTSEETLAPDETIVSEETGVSEESQPAEETSASEEWLFPEDILIPEEDSEFNEILPDEESVADSGLLTDDETELLQESAADAITMETALSGALDLFPAAPKLLSLTSAGSRSITISWNGVEGAESYEILRCGVKDAAYVTIAKVQGDVFSYTDLSCENGILYQYTVRAVRGEEFSNVSSGFYGRTRYDLPAAYKSRATDITPNGFKVTGSYVASAKISSISAAIWTPNGGQDDIETIIMTPENGMVHSDGTFSFAVSTSAHKSESGDYVIHIRCTDVNGEKNPETYYMSVSVPSVLPVLSGPSVSNASASGFDVSAMCSVPAGIKSYGISVWSDSSGRSGAVSAENIRLSSGVLYGHVNSAALGGSGVYHIIFSVEDKNGKKTSCEMDFTCDKDPETEVKITTINTGSGDCQLISSRGEHFMIDTGLDEDKVDETIRALQQNGVSHFSALVTHCHMDHMLGLDILSDLYTIDCVYVPTHISDVYMDQIAYEQLIAKLQGKGIRVLPLPEAGSSLTCGDVRIDVIYQRNRDLYENSSCNNSSIWLSISCGDFRYLTCGDSEKSLEQEALPSLTGSYDMVKLNHHGEASANSQEFLAATGAMIALISSGIHNRSLVVGKEMEGETAARTQGMTVYDTYRFGTITNYIINGRIQTLIGGKKESYYLAIEKAEVVNVTSSGYRVVVTFYASEGVSKVLMPTWSEKNGQDDLKWLQASVSGNTAVCDIKTSDFKESSGNFITHVYVYDNTGKQVIKGAYATVPAASSGSSGGGNSGTGSSTQPGAYTLSIKKVTVSDVTAQGYKVTVEFDSSAGVSKVLMPTWSDKNGQDDLKWLQASVSGNTAVCEIRTSDFKEPSGNYTTHVYVYDKTGKYVLKGAYAVVPEKTEEIPESSGSGNDGSGTAGGESSGNNDAADTGNSGNNDTSDTGNSGNNDSSDTGSTVIKSWKYQNVEYAYVFDAAYYLAKYPDLKKAYGTDEQKAFNHFIKHGMKECRQASANFNVIVYQARYADLRAAFGNNMEKYYIHYCKHGYQENRIAK